MMAHASNPPTKGGLDEIEFEALPVDDGVILPEAEAELSALQDVSEDDELSSKKTDVSSSDSSPLASDDTVEGADGGHPFRPISHW